MARSETVRDVVSGSWSKSHSRSNAFGRDFLLWVALKLEMGGETFRHKRSSAE